MALGTTAGQLSTAQRPRSRLPSLVPWILPVLLVLGWQLTLTFGLFKEYQLPPPLKVITSAANLWERGLLQSHIVTTIVRVFFGFGIGVGVALLGLTPGKLSGLGIAFALLAGLAWACYILLSAETGRRWPGLSGLTIASVVGALALAGPSIAAAGADLLQPRILLLGLTVGVLSSVIPYSLELTALRRIPPRVFGILMSLEPAAAAIAAMILLSEFLSWTQWLAVACVVLASVGATRSARPPAEPIAI